jgi:hypothetical protein
MGNASIVTPFISGFLALLGSYFGAKAAFRTKIWEQKRHDYGQLLLAIESEEQDQGKRLNEIIRRLELVALVGSRDVSVKAEQILSDARHDKSKLLGKPPDWRQEMFNIMRKDIQPWAKFQIPAT